MPEEEGVEYVVMEHRRQIFGGTHHKEYGHYTTRADALEAINTAPDEFGVDYTVERRKLQK